MKRYFQYLREYKLHCILGPLFKWIEAALELMVPLVMKSIIDVGVANGNIRYVLIGGGIMLGAFFMATDYVTSPTTDKG